MKYPGITFEVDAVQPATEPLPQIPYREAIESLLKAERVNKGAGYRPVESCNRLFDRLVAGVDYHPLVHTLHRAYADHRAVSLSPDMIWLLICQGVAHHINANAETLRKQFVQHEGKKELVVRRGDFRKGSPENPWPEVFGEFSKQIREHIGPKHELFVASFSTTGPVERAACEVVLLDAMKKYFDYTLVNFICGIPAITLEGTTADWECMLKRLDGFEPLGLEWWFKYLRPILEQFVAASSGDVDRRFWQAIYRIVQPPEICRSSYRMGWINLFFPYLNGKDGLPTARNPWLTGDRNLEDLLEPPPDRNKDDARAFWIAESKMKFMFGGEYPAGLSQAPFKWTELADSGAVLNRWDMEFLGGFVGITQDAETLRLRPEIGWAVREASADVAQDRPWEDKGQSRMTAAEHERHLLKSFFGPKWHEGPGATLTFEVRETMLVATIAGKVLLGDSCYQMQNDLEKRMTQHIEAGGSAALFDFSALQIASPGTYKFVLVPVRRAREFFRIAAVIGDREWLEENFKGENVESFIDCFATQAEAVRFLQSDKPLVDPRRYDHKLWNNAVSDVGPEKCRHEGCEDLRLSLSVFCRRHHYEGVRGVRYIEDVDS